MSYSVRTFEFPFFNSLITQISQKPHASDELDPRDGKPRFTFDGWVIYSAARLLPSKERLVVDRDIKWKKRHDYYKVMYDLEQKVKNILWQEFADLQGLSQRLKVASATTIENTRNRRETMKGALWQLVWMFDRWVKKYKDQS